MSDITDDLSDLFSSKSEKRSSVTKQQLERGLSDIPNPQSQELDAVSLQRWSSHGDTPPQSVKKRSSSILFDWSPELLEDDDEDAGERSVSFGELSYVRSYERILEVHPSTSSGPSLGIGWKFVEQECATNLVWDKNKDSTDFRLSREQRERIIKDDLGYSQKDIARAVRECQKLKSRRRRTINNLSESNKFMPLEKVEYAMEKLSKRLQQRLGSSRLR